MSTAHPRADRRSVARTFAPAPRGCGSRRPPSRTSAVRSVWVWQGCRTSASSKGEAPMALKDIRDLKDDKESYAAELERRWTGLLSYRYIGRRSGSMDVGADGDNTVKVRHDFRNSTGGAHGGAGAPHPPGGGG